jgi:hypothetical protein
MQCEGRGDDSIPEYLIVHERCIGYRKSSSPPVVALVSYGCWFPAHDGFHGDAASLGFGRTIAWIEC